MPQSKKNTYGLSTSQIKDSQLFEVAWEVCNQVGGIHTVIKSKVESALSQWGQSRYCLIGPYVHKDVSAVFDPIDESDTLIGRAVNRMRSWGFEVHYGRWLVSGRPKVVLLNPNFGLDNLGNLKKSLWESHYIPSGDGDHLIDQVLSLGQQIAVFFKALHEENHDHKNLIGHFHEWMVGTVIPELRREDIPITTVFTTHATILGRYLAMNDPEFYTNLVNGTYDWQSEATHFNIESQVAIERAAAHGAHIFTTVSEVTARECEYLVGRKVDCVLPNGINIEKFEALHEFQNLHRTYKQKIDQFVMGHFFQSYSFDLDNTLYFFTSGRYEYKNKGFDLTLEALARLNHRLKEMNSDKTIVFFFITKRPYYSINAECLHSRAVMQEIRQICDDIEEQVGNRLFYMATSQQKNQLPHMQEMVDESLRLKLRRTVQAWRSDKLPSVVTHNLVDDHKDEILNFIRSSGLINRPEDRVKIVYHPDFVSSMNPLFGMDYSQFVRGCHMGVFPSYYEPWGYTPLECVASGIPAVTSDLSGFGDFVLNHLEQNDYAGIYVNNRKHGNYHNSADDLTDTLFKFTQKDRRERIALRNSVEESSTHFDWESLSRFYGNAYHMALERS
ncbi:glycosyltransferase [Sediminitomix flava]|uniref:Glycogen(Starch) synthase n=1 Tax=Sediminitomix flava TaxID=379075 RepID=A0A315ZXF7_SEDFL|nr:glycosyltransferase [Sediminitomix flava]PWJ42027.1 glycogen(starch) synthase [Sediminitomix flava]